LFADRVRVPFPVLIRLPVPLTTPLMIVAAVLVTASVLFRPFRVTEPVAVIVIGLLPASATEALLSTTPLFRDRPPTAVVASAPAVRVKVPAPMAAGLPRFKVLPARLVVPLKALAVGRLIVPAPARVRLVPLTGALMVRMEPELVVMIASPRTRVPPPVIV